MEMSTEQGGLHLQELLGTLGTRHCCCTRSHPWLHQQLQTLETMTVLVPRGRLAPLSQHQPGWDRGQTLAQSMAVSTRAVGWCCWCSLGVGASLGFVTCLSFWETEEKL